MQENRAEHSESSTAAAATRRTTPGATLGQTAPAARRATPAQTAPAARRTTPAQTTPAARRTTPATRPPQPFKAPRPGPAQNEASGTSSRPVRARKQSSRMSGYLTTSNIDNLTLSDIKKGLL